MQLPTFLFINFFVSMFSDIALNDLANEKGPKFFKSNIILSLKPYFANKSIIVSGIYAALTICITLVVLALISKLLFGFMVPSTFTELYKYLILAFMLGYLVDIAIDKFDLFGKSLRPYYKVAGAGFWGALAFVVSIIISFFIQKNILPLLK
jgi:hypothetical protein